MKKILVILAAAVAAVSCNNARCLIQGEVLGVEDGMVYLTEAGRNGAVVDSTAVTNGKFTFKVDEAGVALYAVKTADDTLCMLFTEDGVVAVAGNASDSSVVATGTVANEAMNVYNADMTLFNQRYAQAADEQTRQTLISEYYEFLDKTIEENMGNAFGVTMFVQNKSYELSAAEMIAELEKLSENLKTMPLVVKTIDKCNRKKLTEPRAEGSDFVPTYINIEQPDVDGQMVSLQSVVEKQGNKYVLLDFWASWCGPCMGEMPYLKEAYLKYHKKGFEIFGVSFDSKAEAWKGAIKTQGMKWVNVSLLQSFKNEAAENYVVESIPTNFLIDCATGEIIAKNLRGEAVVEKLKELL